MIGGLMFARGRLMAGWKNRFKGAFCAAYKLSGLARLQEALANRAGQQRMTILLFHRVTDAIPEDGLTVHPQRFRRICALLAREFRVVSLGEVFRVARSGEPMPTRTVAITFDDCYRDNLEAARVLSQYGLPATFFLPTGYIESGRAFDWDRHLPPLPNLSWRDVREMVGMGFEVGSHTVSHADLGAIDAQQALHELVASKAALEERLAQPVRWLAYPYGGLHNLRPEWLPLCEEAGYQGVVSAMGGAVRPGDGRGPGVPILPRQAVPPFRTLCELELYLTGSLDPLQALKRRLWGSSADPPGNGVVRQAWPLPPTQATRGKEAETEDCFRRELARQVL